MHLQAKDETDNSWKFQLVAVLPATMTLILHLHQGQELLLIL